jgi:hypothetical protein
MKKILLTLIAVATLTSFSFAQKVNKGIKGGLNYANVGNFDQLPEIDDITNLTSWHAGVFLGVKVAMISVQGDVLYSVQGTNYTDLSGEEHKLENAYINIPVVVKLHFIPKLNVQAGLQYGILFSSKVDGETDYQIGGTTVEDYFKGGDWAIPIGIGLDISKLMIELRYNIGVADINNISLDETKLSNGVFQASLGIKF